MKGYAWNVEKNRWLIEERGISFERVVHLVEHGGLLDVVAHHNQERYPNQRILIVSADDYAYLVPFIEAESHYFL